jgi:hypothetical protein
MKARVATEEVRCVMKKLSAGVMLAAALMAASSTAALASTNVLKVKPRTVNFGPTPVGMVTSKSTTLTNTSSNPIDLTINVTKDWDDFSFGFGPGSTCPTFEPTALGPGESCVFVVRFWPSEQFLGLKQDQRFLATATDPLTGDVLDSDTFVFLGRAA